ncbi:MAG TPA: ABC transporter permease [Terracidiphilus sp.]|nr:ABC transporter permease [Terracidiphilus sp.]
MRGFFRKLSILFTRRLYRAQLEEEMAFHREQAEREMIADGMLPGTAHIAAARQFGNPTRLRERSHEVVGFRAESVLQDLRYAFRQIRKNPGFALTAIFILALGMGVSVGIFGFVDAALLQPLPYADPNRLMDVAEKAHSHPRSNLSYQDFKDWARMNRSFSSLDAYTGGGLLMRSSSGTEPVPVERVTDGFFRTLGVRPALGRDFRAEEGRPGGAKVVMLSYGAWINRFGGRSNIAGTSVTLNGDNYTIVGVLPRSFSFVPRGNAELWVPIADPSDCETRRSCHDLFAVGRLRDGVTPASALADMQAIAKQLERMYPGSNQGQGASVIPFAEAVQGDIRPILLTLLSAAALLLLIACLNVSSLVLVRSESRRREIAVRGALGANRTRIARQFATEGMLLAVVGCAAGLAEAMWLMSMLVHMVPKDTAERLPFLALVGLNTHTLLFAGAVACGAALLLAAMPTLRLSFLPIQAGLGEGGRGGAGRLWQRLGANLVVAELTVAVVLLSGAGLLGRSFYKLLHVDLGFDPAHLAMVNVQLPPNPYSTPQSRIDFYREAERRLSVLPGVQSVGITSDLPAQCLCDTDWIRIVGKPFHGEHNEVDERDVSPTYLATLKARLIRGRFFTEQEDQTKPQVIVINETLARKYFPGEDPIGKKIADGGLTPASMREVVGVIADLREGALDEEMWPSEYFTLYQQQDSNFTVLVRTTQDEGAMLPTLQGALRAINPNIGLYSPQTMEGLIDSTETALLHRFSTWLVGGFAVVAFLLGVVGLYGVVAYSVSQRTREIGVRMALGAQRATVYRMVMRQAGWLTLLGVTIGLACAIGASLAMRKLLFGIAAWDVPTLAAVAIALGAASLVASYLPARRAALVNPIEALRTE